MGTFTKVSETGLNAIALRSAVIIAAVFLAGGGVACSSDKSEPVGLTKTNSYRSGYQAGSSAINFSDQTRSSETDSEIRKGCTNILEAIVEWGDKDWGLKPGAVNQDEWIAGCVAAYSG